MVPLLFPFWCLVGPIWDPFGVHFGSLSGIIFRCSPRFICPQYPMYIRCTNRVQPVYKSCTTRVQPVYNPCTTSVQLMYKQTAQQRLKEVSCTVFHWLLRWASLPRTASTWADFFQQQLDSTDNISRAAVVARDHSNCDESYNVHYMNCTYNK